MRASGAACQSTTDLRIKTDFTDFFGASVCVKQSTADGQDRMNADGDDSGQDGWDEKDNKKIRKGSQFISGRSRGIAFGIRLLSASIPRPSAGESHQQA
jgi:hypothetical protein